MDLALHIALADCASNWDSKLEALFRSEVSAEELRKALSEYELGETKKQVHTVDWTEDSIGVSVAYEDPGCEESIIRTLDGIEAFKGIEKIMLDFSEVADLEPLVKLKKLKALRLCVEPGTSLEPLLRCKKLGRVALRCKKKKTLDEQVLKALQKQGVFVDSLVPKEPKAAPFSCWRLKLAVLDTLAELSLIELPRIAFFDEYHLDERILAHVTNLSVKQSLLDKIERLSWSGGGHRIQHIVWSQWDGESNEFDLTSLDGIEKLRNLRELQLGNAEQIDEGELDAVRERGVEVEID